VALNKYQIFNRFLSSVPDDEKANDLPKKTISPFSMITSLESLKVVFPHVTIKKQDVHESNESLFSTDAATAFGDRVMPGLVFIISFLRGQNEKSRFFIVFEVIKEFIRLGRGDSDTIEVDTAEGGFVTNSEIGATKPSDVKLSELSDLFLEHEPYDDDPVVTSRGTIEFVVYDGPGQTAKIRTIIEVKKGIDFGPIEPVQLYAELLSSVQRNYRIDPTYTGKVGGLLSDGYRWQFYSASRDPSSTAEEIKYIIERRGGSLRLLDIHAGDDANDEATLKELLRRSGTNESFRCMESIYRTLFPEAGAIDKT
jgi:hypothetical protein